MNFDEWITSSAYPYMGVQEVSVETWLHNNKSSLEAAEIAWDVQETEITQLRQRIADLEQDAEFWRISVEAASQRVRELEAEQGIQKNGLTTGIIAIDIDEE